MGAVKNMLETAAELVNSHPYINGSYDEWRETNIARFANQVPCSLDVAEYFVNTAITKTETENRSDRHGV